MLIRREKRQRKSLAFAYNTDIQLLHCGSPPFGFRSKPSVLVSKVPITYLFSGLAPFPFGVKSGLCDFLSV